ncbi:MAG: hypothetical protein IKL23_06215 [Oscillospiraceae bacterium]|nr:hypothetical protein [Oscillospiraceae bacterium]
MRRDEVIRMLRQVEPARLFLGKMEDALGCLDEEQRDILEVMFLRPKAGAADFLCEKLDIERSSVYRRRDKALRCLANLLQGWGTDAG